MALMKGREKEKFHACLKIDLLLSNENAQGVL